MEASEEKVGQNDVEVIVRKVRGGLPGGEGVLEQGRGAGVAASPPPRRVQQHPPRPRGQGWGRTWDKSVKPKVETV